MKYVLLIFVSFLMACSSLLSPTIGSQLSEYEKADNPKALSRYLFRQEPLDSAELNELLEWSLANRWQFLKFVDHLRGSDKERFHKAFPVVLKSSPLEKDFRKNYEDSPSRSIQKLLE